MSMKLTLDKNKCSTLWSLTYLSFLWENDEIPLKLHPNYDLYGSSIYTQEEEREIKTQNIFLWIIPWFFSFKLHHTLNTSQGICFMPLLYYFTDVNWSYFNLFHLLSNLFIFFMQETLEAHDGASKGKYTIGLGQDCMAFCTELEDVISMRFLLWIW